MMEFWRQGDVGLVKVDTLPEGGETVVRINGRLVIKEGEKTGHSHTITAPYVKMIETADARYIVSKRAFKVFHQEHEVAFMPPGIYEVPEQVEYVAQEIRRVLD